MHTQTISLTDCDGLPLSLSLSFSYSNLQRAAPYQFPDAAFSVQRDGTNRIMFWSDGNTYRVVGEGIFPNATVSTETNTIACSVS